jgi:hypothetical protein
MNEAEGVCKTKSSEGQEAKMKRTLGAKPLRKYVLEQVSAQGVEPE